MLPNKLQHHVFGELKSKLLPRQTNTIPYTFNVLSVILLRYTFVLPSKYFLSWLFINCMQHFLVLNVASEATLRHIHKLYRLYIFMREGRHFVLYVLNGEATLWHRLNVHELYSFFAVYQQTNKCTDLQFLTKSALSATLHWVCYKEEVGWIMSVSPGHTMLEAVCGCFMPCNVFLAGNIEVSLELQCFTAELITYIVCECDAPEWRYTLPSLIVLPAPADQPSSTFTKPHRFQRNRLTGSGNPTFESYVEEKAQ